MAIRNGRQRRILKRVHPLWRWIPIQTNRSFRQRRAMGRFRRPLGLAVKRLIDVVIASALLILCLPLFVVTAILIKFDSAGPVFFRQERLGIERPVVSDFQISNDDRRCRSPNSRFTRRFC